jgi:hypothetical protein
MKLFHWPLLVFFVTILSSFHLTAHEKGCDCLSAGDYSCFVSQDGDKIYLDPQAIIIIDNHFYLNVDNSPMAVSVLFSDSAGIYLSRNKESERGWTCPICGHRNPPNTFPCELSYLHFIHQPENRWKLGRWKNPRKFMSLLRGPVKLPHFILADCFSSSQGHPLC